MVNIVALIRDPPRTASTFTFGAGTPFQPGPPGHHQRVLLLRIERLGAAASFPECELILRNNRGTRLLVFLPALTGFAPGQTRHLYVADDGSTYFARDAHDAGLPDLNPDSARFGAYLPRHLARAALGQVRPRPGIRPVAHRRAVSRDLCCWDQPLQKPPSAGEVAVYIGGQMVGAFVGFGRRPATTSACSASMRTSRSPS